MNITIGQYYPVESSIHSLDARIKIFCLALYIAALFIGDTFVNYIVCTFFVFFATVLSKIPLKLLLNGLKPLYFIIIFTSVINVCFSYGENVLFSFGIINITFEGIVSAIKIVIRLVLLIGASSLLTLTTAPLDLADATESILKPLKLIKFPVHDIAMMMSIALRFIPTLTDEADKIKKAQIARGADFDEKGIAQKAKSLLVILVPLFVSAFRRADELATAMEARCYRGDINRTKMITKKVDLNDLKALAISFLFLIFVIFLTYFFKCIL